MPLKQTEIDFSQLPNRSLARAWTDEVLDFLFLGQYTAEKKTEIEASLKRSLEELLQPVAKRLNTKPETVTGNFFKRLNKVYDNLLDDANFFVAADPAAESIEEVIIAYPGFYAISIYRIANELYKLNVPILPRLITEYAHTKTGIDIHPGATIGVPFFIDHGTGVVVGQTTVIGNYVKMYQGVTLGALAVRKEETGAKRHPTIENNVIIYAGSCILGGRTVVGHDSVIGGNVWLTESIQPYSIVYHTDEVKVRDKSEMREVIDFVI